MLTLGLFVCIWLFACAFMKRQSGELLLFDRESTIPLRGLLIVVIMLAHLTCEGVNTGLICHFMWQNAAVAVFFFMSGYGYMRAINSGKQKRFVDFAFGIVRKLFVPFLIVAILGLGRICVCEGLDWGRMVQAYSNGHTPIGVHSWFIWVLSLLAIILSVTARFFHGWVLIGVNCVFSAALFAIFRWWQWPRWWWLSLSAFPVGLAFSYCENRIRISMRRNAWHWMLVGGVFLGVELLNYCIGGNVFEGVMRSLVGPVVVVGFYVFPISKNCTPLYFLGGISFELYLVHGLIRTWMLYGVVDGSARTLIGFIAIPVSILAAMALQRINQSIKWQRHLK